MTAPPSLSLRQRLQQPGLVTAPGVHDMVSLRMADAMGFDALYMTGFGTVASHLGLPDAGLATYSDMVGRVRQMAGMARTPLIADGDTGYGGLLNVQHTVQGYEAAGAQAIQLEDQEVPKKCGHTPGRRVVPMADMVKKIQVAAASRRSKDFLIIARTDARTTLGLDEALRRAEAYARAGADILFVESPESVEEMQTSAAAPTCRWWPTWSRAAARRCCRRHSSRPSATRSPSSRSRPCWLQPKPCAPPMPRSASTARRRG